MCTHDPTRAGHENQHAGGIGTSLRRDIRPEAPGHDQIDNRERNHQRPIGGCPLGCHTVTRQIAGHHVQKSGHRRCTRKPQNEDRTDVVDRAEEGAEERTDGVRTLTVREVGKRPIDCSAFQFVPVGILLNLAGLVCLGMPKFLRRNEFVGACHK